MAQRNRLADDDAGLAEKNPKSTIPIVKEMVYTKRSQLKISEETRMANFALPLFNKPSEAPRAEVKEKANSALVCVGGVCLFCWGVAGFVVTLGLLSKFFGLI